MIIMPVKEGENIERALKKFKRKYERTGVLKELRRRQYFTSRISEGMRLGSFSCCLFICRLSAVCRRSHCNCNAGRRAEISYQLQILCCATCFN